MIDIQKLSAKKIDQWCEFISNHLYKHDLFGYFDVPNQKSYQFGCQGTINNKKQCIRRMLLNLDECFFNASYYVDIEKIQNFNNYLNKQCTDEKKEISKLPHNIRVQALTHLDLTNEKKYLKKMTNRQYLQWRLKYIKDGYGKHIPEAPISLKSTIGLAFLSLIGMYCFFTLKTKPSTKILMGILNLFVVPAFVYAIVFDLSLYFLIPAAVVYGLFVLASCIHVGLRRYKENVKYQEEFGNTYNEIMTYLNRAEPQKPLEDKINDLKKEENIINIEGKKEKKRIINESY